MSTVDIKLTSIVDIKLMLHIDIKKINKNVFLTQIFFSAIFVPVVMFETHSWHHIDLDDICNRTSARCQNQVYWCRATILTKCWHQLEVRVPTGYVSLSVHTFKVIAIYFEDMYDYVIWSDWCKCQRIHLNFADMYVGFCFTYMVWFIIMLYHEHSEKGEVFWS